MAEERKIRTVRGVVESAKQDKTIVIRVERLVMHPLYKKYVRRHTKYYAHDEQNQANEGDTVEIYPTRPLSKLKRWRLGEIVSTRAGASS